MEHVVDYSVEFVLVDLPVPVQIVLIEQVPHVLILVVQVREVDTLKIYIAKFNIQEIVGVLVCRFFFFLEKEFFILAEKVFFQKKEKQDFEKF